MKHLESLLSKITKFYLSLIGFILLFVSLLLFPFLLRATGLSDSLQQVLVSAGVAQRPGILNDFARKIMEDNPEQAYHRAQEALKLSRDLHNLKEEARALYMMADASYYMNNLDEAVTLYLESAGVEKRLGGRESEGYLNRIGDAGHTCCAGDRHPEALKYMLESLELSLNGGYDSQAASMYSNIGSIYTEWGDYARALEYDQKALEIDRRIGGREQISTDLNNIGKIYEHWGKYDEAVRYYQESYALAKSLDNKAMIAVRLNNIGIVYQAWHRYTEALDYFQQALAIERSIGNIDKIGRRLLYIASTYLAMEQYDKCLSCLSEASPVVKKSGLVDDLARFYNVYGKYYLATNQNRKAIELFEQSQLFALKNNLKLIQMANLQSIAQAYEKLGMAAKSLEHYKQFMTVKDSVFNAESNTRLAEFQTRFETEKMKFENEVLKKDAKLKWNVYVLSGIATLAIISILLSIILILRIKTRNARQSKMMAEQESRQLELELEIKNKELTFNAMSIIKKNETVSEMIGVLEKAIREGQSAEIMDSVFEKIRNNGRDDTWKEFEVRFTQVHKDFYDKLNDRYPELTPNERKLCAFLRLNMTTKDIASITHQSVHSINVARTRLRRKMNLANSEENLVTCLMSI